MIYLEQAQFKPAMIFFSVLFLPAIIALIVATLATFKIIFLLLMLAFILLYLLLILVFWKISNKKNRHLSLDGDVIRIVYPDVNNGKGQLEIHKNQVISISYYSPFSVKGWLIITSYIFPNSVFLTYTYGGIANTKFIGYMDGKTVNTFAQACDIELTKNPLF